MAKLDWQKNKKYVDVYQMQQFDEKKDKYQLLYEDIDKIAKQAKTKKPLKRSYKKSTKGSYKWHYILDAYLQSDCASTEEFEKKFISSVKRLMKKNKEYDKPVFTKFFKGKYCKQDYKEIFKKDTIYLMWYFWNFSEERMYILQNIDLLQYIDFYFERVPTND